MLTDQNTKNKEPSCETSINELKIIKTNYELCTLKTESLNNLQHDLNECITNNNALKSNSNELELALNQFKKINNGVIIGPDFNNCDREVNELRDELRRLENLKEIEYIPECTCPTDPCNEAQDIIKSLTLKNEELSYQIKTSELNQFDENDDESIMYRKGMDR
eukprot:UN24149